MQQTQATARTALPDDVESPRTKLVYLYLDVTGPATVEDLQDGLGMRKLTLYSVLKTLRNREYVTRSGDAYALAC